MAYLLRDLFTGGSVAVGTRTATPGPGSGTIIDSGGNLSIDTAQSRLIVAGGSGTWDDPSDWYPLDGATFGAVVTIIRITGVGDDGPALILHSAANVAPTAAGMGVWFDFPQFAPDTATEYISKPATRVRSIDYMLIVVKRAGGGAIALLCGGIYGAFPNGTPAWIYDSDSIGATAYVGLTSKASAWRSSNLTVITANTLTAELLARYGVATAADTFTRANGALSGSSTEVGSLTWANSLNSFTIASNAAIGQASVESRAYVIPATQPRIIEATITTPSSGSVWAAIMFRFRASDQNFLMFRLESAKWILEQRTGAAGGTSTTVVQSGFTPSASTAYRMRVLDYGTHVRTFINDTETSLGGVATTFNNTETGVGITQARQIDNGSTIDNFAAWPQTITLPPALGPFPTPPIGIGAALSTDAFTAADGTAITTYDAAFSTTGSGTWQINSNKARMTAAAATGYAHRDSGMTDMAVSCDVTLPSTAGAYPSSPFDDWFCGVMARWTDASNYLIARYLYQSDSPEVEVWQQVAGAGTLLCFVNLGAGALALGSTHALTLVAVGPEVAAYHDGELVAQGYTTLLSGTRAGIGVEAPAAGQPSFDNLVIKAAEGMLIPSLLNPRVMSALHRK